MRPDPSAPLHILIIEDDAGVVRAWKMLLEMSRRHQIETAATGDQAIDLYRHADRPFDLIICDGQLGPDDQPGWTIIARLQAVSGSRNQPFPPVLAAPGTLTEATEKQWRAVGVLHFHPKPFDVLNVLRTISELTRRDVGPA